MLKQPQGQKVLTNIAVVRLVKKGLRFEIACYPNTVSVWRKGVEMPLSEVLQLTRIYQSVEKGTVAKKQDLKQAFQTTDQDTIIEEILRSGEIQTGGKERKVELDALKRDVHVILSQKLIHAETKKAITVTMAERLVKQLKYTVVTSKSAKQQAQTIMKLLKDHPEIPFERAPMVVAISVAPQDEAAVFAAVEGSIKERRNLPQAPPDTSLLRSEVVVDPSAWRTLEALTKEIPSLRLELVSLQCDGEA